MLQQTSVARVTNGTRRILLVEDNPADANLSRIVHEETKHCSWLQIIENGEKALRYLRGEGEYSGTCKPDVILLDLTLPITSGLEMISQIRSVPDCELMPIVIISGAENPIELRQAYELGASCVIIKPTQWKEYFEKLDACYKFWCSVVQLPPKTNGYAKN